MMFVENLVYPQNFFEDAFSTLLKGKARDYYYDNVTGQDYTFDTTKKMVKTHFETNERRQAILSKWDSIPFKKIIQKNENQSLIDCFESTLEDLHDV